MHTPPANSENGDFSDKPASLVSAADSSNAPVAPLEKSGEVDVPTTSTAISTAAEVQAPEEATTVTSETGATPEGSDVVPEKELETATSIAESEKPVTEDEASQIKSLQTETELMSSVKKEIPNEGQGQAVSEETADGADEIDGAEENIADGGEEKIADGAEEQVNEEVPPNVQVSVETEQSVEDESVTEEVKIDDSAAIPEVSNEAAKIEPVTASTEGGREEEQVKTEENAESEESGVLPAEEKIQKYSDDEISLDSDSEPESSSASESESGSEFQSTSDSESESETESISAQEKADLHDFDDDEDVTSGPILSKNEVTDERAPELPAGYQVSANAPLEYIGDLVALVERSAIIKASVSGEFRILKESSVLCFEDRTLLGPLFETFGRLQTPNYRVKFNSDEVFEQMRQRLGHRVFYVVSDSQFVYTDAIKKMRGTDASNCHDEELPEDEQEYSDDEQELAAKQDKKRKKKQKRGDTAEPAKKKPTAKQDQQFVSYGFAQSAQPVPAQAAYASYQNPSMRAEPYQGQQYAAQQPYSGQQPYPLPEQYPQAYQSPAYQAQYQQAYPGQSFPQQFQGQPQYQNPYGVAYQQNVYPQQVRYQQNPYYPQPYGQPAPQVPAQIGQPPIGRPAPQNQLPSNPIAQQGANGNWDNRSLQQLQQMVSSQLAQNADASSRQPPYEQNK